MTKDFINFLSDSSWIFNDYQKKEVNEEKSFICSNEFEDKFPSFKTASEEGVKYTLEKYGII